MSNAIQRIQFLLQAEELLKDYTQKTLEAYAESLIQIFTSKKDLGEAEDEMHALQLYNIASKYESLLKNYLADEKVIKTLDSAQLNLVQTQVIQLGDILREIRIIVDRLKANLTAQNHVHIQVLDSSIEKFERECVTLIAECKKVIPLLSASLHSITQQLGMKGASNALAA